MNVGSAKGERRPPLPRAPPSCWCQSASSVGVMRDSLATIHGVGIWTAGSASGPRLLASNVGLPGSCSTCGRLLLDADVPLWSSPLAREDVRAAVSQALGTARTQQPPAAGLWGEDSSMPGTSVGLASMLVGSFRAPRGGSTDIAGTRPWMSSCSIASTCNRSSHWVPTTTHLSLQHCPIPWPMAVGIAHPLPPVWMGEQPEESPAISLSQKG
mmetsp:Transcript_137447/g.383299  ORF Transcript_137447/g.383299 Transcript_137447/m.383299 type:complete len:213 (+) Transcript_137447:222-860(+)